MPLIPFPLWDQTIFEINATSRTLASTVMRSKRRHDHALIEKYQRGQQEKRAAALKGQRLCPVPPALEGEGEGDNEEDLQVMGQGWGLALETWTRSSRLCWGLMQWFAGSFLDPFQDVFSNVSGQKRKQGRGEEGGPRKKLQQSVQQDKDFYIPYRPKDFESERG